MSESAVRCAGRGKDRSRMDIKLSDRLEMVVSFVLPGSCVADVGTDHGYVPIVLVKRGIAARALAMDIREGPLARAREHISRYGLEGQIGTRLSDGVRGLEPGEADTVIAAGMGGELIVHILREGQRLWDTVGHWILSPQSEPEKVRRYLQENGFRIAGERMLCEDGKFYVVMDAVRGEMEPLNLAQAVYGPCLIREKDPVLYDFLKREEDALSRILDGLEGRAGKKAAAGRDQIRERLACARYTMHLYGDEYAAAGRTGCEGG